MQTKTIEEKTPEIDNSTTIYFINHTTKRFGETKPVKVNKTLSEAGVKWEITFPVYVKTHSDKIEFYLNRTEFYDDVFPLLTKNYKALKTK